jgi:hypothetical protein
MMQFSSYCTQMYLSGVKKETIQAKVGKYEQTNPYQDGSFKFENQVDRVYNRKRS